MMERYAHLRYIGNMKKTLLIGALLFTGMALSAGIVQDVQKIMDGYVAALNAFNTAMNGVSNARGAERAIDVLVREMAPVQRLVEAFEARYGEDYEPSPADEMRLAELSGNFEEGFMETVMEFTRNMQQCAELLSATPNGLSKLERLSEAMEALDALDF